MLEATFVLMSIFFPFFEFHLALAPSFFDAMTDVVHSRPSQGYADITGDATQKVDMLISSTIKHRKGRMRSREKVIFTSLEKQQRQAGGEKKGERGEVRILN